MNQMSCKRTVRVEYTREHDKYLIKYIAKYCPTKDGRSGRKLYECLVEDEQNQWPWAVHHTAQSWRERYVKNSDRFDAAILDHQNKHRTKSGAGKKRAVESTSVETLGPPAKRAKREGERVPSSETPTEQGLFTQDTNPSSPTPTPNRHRAPRRALPSPEPEPTHSQDSTPQRPTDTTETSSIPDLLSVQIPGDTLESTGKQVPPPTDGEPQSQPQPLTSSRSTKRFKERPRATSDVFASDPPTSQGDAVAVPDVNVAGPSSQTRLTPASHTGADDIPVPISMPTYPRAPPRLVNTFQGQVLVDRNGRVPRLLSQGEKDVLREEEEEGEEEEAQDSAQWPPVRGRAAKQKKASEPEAEVDAHHPFSRPIVPPRPEAPKETGEREPGGQLHPPTGLIPPIIDGTLPDLCTEIHGVVTEVVSRQCQDVATSGASPIKRVVSPPSGSTSRPDLLNAVLTKWQLNKPSMFPPPRASSPFRPEPPPPGGHRDRHSPPQLQPQLQSLPRSPSKAARHPALTRLRRETIAHGGQNGHSRRKQRERRRPHASVPSIDLVALSRSSLSARSHSRTSAEADVSSDPVRPKLKAKAMRWSFPAMMGRHVDTIEDEGGASGSGSGSGSRSGSGSPFRWTAPEWGHGAVWTSSPTRPLARASTSFPSLSPSALALAPFSHSFSSPLPSVPLSLFPSLGPPSELVPHAADISLVASHGLASMLARMSANHGMALGVVQAVYARVGSLKEADEVLKGMREAAEGWGEREIERLVWDERNGSGSGTGSGKGRGRKRKGERGRTRLRYVVASEDGEGSEYSPPETSRAAMWKRRSQSASHADEELEEQERGEVEVEVTEDGAREDEDEEEDGRQVEKELQQDDENNDDEVVSARRETGDAQEVQELADTQDLWTVEQVILDNQKAYELERWVGKGRFGRELLNRFR